MKRVLLVGLALAGATTVASQAVADTFVVRESVSRYIACYNKEYVPAKVLVNTRGIRVRGESQGWEIGPTRWDRVRDPGVYIQTRRTIERDHYTLIRTGCP
jgi:hypothetical protein